MSITRRSHSRSRPQRTVKQRRRVFTNDHEPVVSVIIPALNERRTIGAVIQEAFHVHPRTEVIVVASGSTDGTQKIAAQCGAIVIHDEYPLGHDVGRYVGAQIAKGEVLLFVDGDMVIPSLQLAPFVQAVLSGIDVALNEYLGPLHRSPVHRVIVSKHILNIMLRRADLSGVSMTTVPHAISRRALHEIGVTHLAIPPLALTIAQSKGLKIQAVHNIHVGKLNPRRLTRAIPDPLERLITGDHMEAISWLLQEKGSRGGFTDLHRLRHKVR
ncbi:glycosyltransferase family 2 protein [Paenibacillus sp. CMAA1364]